MSAMVVPRFAGSCEMIAASRPRRMAMLMVSVVPIWLTLIGSLGYTCAMHP